VDDSREKANLSLGPDVYRFCNVVCTESVGRWKRFSYPIRWVQNYPVPHVTYCALGQEFNSQTFPVTIKHIYRQFLRIFAHIYHAHFETILHLRAEPHFNSLFAHFLAFGKEYQLLEERDIKGEAGVPVGVGLLWERWKESGKLEHWWNSRRGFLFYIHE